jgi:MOSC domain-containing protein YiiM
MRQPYSSGSERALGAWDAEPTPRRLQRMRGTLLALNVGRVGVLANGRRPVESAFEKTAVAGPLELGREGLPGDEHAWDQHGGPDMAVLVYAHEHYSFWADDYGLELPPSGAFGENFTTRGLVETEVCIGDVFRVGAAVVQVSQPRSPCFKIAARYGIRDLPIRVQESGYTGFLLRVLEEGPVRTGDDVRLERGDEHGMTVAEANRIAHVDRRDMDGARRLLAVPALADGMRSKLMRRVAGEKPSAEGDRLYGD